MSIGDLKYDTVDGWYLEGDMHGETIRILAESRVRDGATIYFKATCQNCQTRMTLSEANTMYPNWECHQCHQTTQPKKFGFAEFRII